MGAVYVVFAPRWGAYDYLKGSIQSVYKMCNLFLQQITQTVHLTLFVSELISKHYMLESHAITNWAWALFGPKCGSHKREHLSAKGTLLNKPWIRIGVKCTVCVIYCMFFFSSDSDSSGQLLCCCGFSCLVEIVMIGLSIDGPPCWALIIWFFFRNF